MKTPRTFSRILTRNHNLRRQTDLPIFGALAEFERERTMAGLAAATVRGRKGGRPRKLTAKQVAMARQLLQDPKQQVTEVAKMLGVARSTLYMALRSESTVKGDK